MTARPSIDDLYAGVVASDRAMVARAITIAESALPSDRAITDALAVRLLPHAGRARRIGISGAPGVGKSTLIDTLGKHVLDAGHRLAVLAVDPSSARTGGSILGDKTRMQRLVASPGAFVRPSPSGAHLGGVTPRTRASILVCEAAGYDVVFVETVGVGQSEIEVADLVDVFLLLVLPGAGDELQGIKRGIMELADVVAITKADGDNLPRAREAARDVLGALRYFEKKNAAWTPRCTLTSAVSGDGIDALWASVGEYWQALDTSGELSALRRRQARAAFWRSVDRELVARIRGDARLAARLAALEADLDGATDTPEGAAHAFVAGLRLEG